jgi:hypothetical protein
VIPPLSKSAKGNPCGLLSAAPPFYWAQIKDLRIHGLRRTAGSYMAIKGVSAAIIYYAKNMYM